MTRLYCDILRASLIRSHILQDCMRIDKQLAINNLIKTKHYLCNKNGVIFSTKTAKCSTKGRKSHRLRPPLRRQFTVISTAKWHILYHA